MQLNVGKEVAAMEEMPVAKLRDCYAEVFGEASARNDPKCHRCGNRGLRSITLSPPVG